MVRPGGGGVPGARGRLCYLGPENIDRPGPLVQDRSQLALAPLAIHHEVRGPLAAGRLGDRAAHATHRGEHQWSEQQRPHHDHRHHRQRRHHHHHFRHVRSGQRPERADGDLFREWRRSEGRFEACLLCEGFHCLQAALFHYGFSILYDSPYNMYQSKYRIHTVRRTLLN